jgi:alcohol dehydrogenase class IV
MLWAAHAAGRAIDVSRTTLAHALSYELTIKFGIPHGHAVALSIPWVFDYNLHVGQRDVADSRGLDFVKRQMVGLGDMTGGATLLRERLKESGLETSLRAIGVEERHLSGIVHHAMRSGRLHTNPRKIGRNSLLALVRRMWEES